MNRKRTYLEKDEVSIATAFFENEYSTINKSVNWSISFIPSTNIKEFKSLNSFSFCWVTEHSSGQVNKNFKYFKNDK